MTRSLPFALLAAASLMSSAAAFAAQTPVKTPAAKPAAKMATHSATRTTTRTASAGAPRMVTTKLANGKSVTYDCSKAGNATKKVCKG